MTHPLDDADDQPAEPRVSDEITRTGRAGFRCGPYVLDTFVDLGGFSEVWTAHHEILDQRAAIKLLRPDRKNAEAEVRFKREIQLVAELDHENVVSFYATGFCDGPSGERLLWLAMELLGGGSLRGRLNAGERFTQEEAVRIAYEMAAGVAAAHELNVVHRDLKPENVILTEARVTKVLDFGIAKFNGRGFRSTGRMRGVLGTPSYMSPEQVSGGTPSYPSDVYQICLMLYELVTGKHAFGYDNGDLPTQTQLCQMQASHVPSPLTTFGAYAEVSAVVAKGLRKDPSERYATAQALADALWEALLAAREHVAEQDAPVDEVNPASSSGQPLGSQARRVYHAAATPPSARPPPMPSRTVKLHPEATTEAPAHHPEMSQPVAPAQKRQERTIRMAPNAPVPTWRGETKTPPPRDAVTEPSHRPPPLAAPREGAQVKAPGWSPRRLLAVLGAGAVLSVGLVVSWLAPRHSSQVRAPITVPAPSAEATAEPAAAPSEPIREPTATPTATVTAAPVAPTATASAAPRATAAAPRARATKPAATVAPAATAAPAVTAVPAETAAPTPTAPHRLFGVEGDSPPAGGAR